MYMRHFLAYVKLTKPRLTALVIATSLAGYYLAAPAGVLHIRLVWFAIGTALSCSGAAALNQYFERGFDVKMAYTRRRPLVAGDIVPVNALNFGLILVLAGVTELVLAVNLLTGFLSLLTVFIYIIIYTPMKRTSWLCTSLGAVSGALPPLGGCAAASGSVGGGAWLLFFILFVWQHPHFYAIAWMHRKDYAAAGFKMLFTQIVFFSLVLIPFTLFPYWEGLLGPFYGAGSLFLGMGMVFLSIKLFFSRSERDTRMLFRASVMYLPVLLLFLIIDPIV
jgi:protoheme IX farnesyltransferase